jgi:hypothetical protein
MIPNVETSQLGGVGFENFIAEMDFHVLSLLDGVKGGGGEQVLAATKPD